MGVRVTKLTEKQFMSQVVQLAKLQRWKVYHTFDSRRSESGFPDLVLVRGKTAMFVELKVGRNHPTEAQYAWLHALGGAGLYATVWRPKDWDEIRAVLERSE
jgi:hypothetical protein